MILAVVTVIFAILILSFLNIKKSKGEGFTSGFRQMYRPHIRNARLIVEGNYNRTKNYFTLTLKKFGII
jgi:hypothetical protein